jgi:hypothetical protein
VIRDPVHQDEQGDGVRDQQPGLSSRRAPSRPMRSSTARSVDASTRRATNPRARRLTDLHEVACPADGGDSWDVVEPPWTDPISEGRVRSHPAMVPATLQVLGLTDAACRREAVGTDRTRRQPCA